MQARGEDLSDGTGAAAMTEAEIEAGKAELTLTRPVCRSMGHKRLLNCRNQRPCSTCGWIVTCWISSGFEVLQTKINARAALLREQMRHHDRR